MVGNESTDVAGGKDFFDSCCLFTWCQATDHHHKPPNALNALVMRPNNPHRNVALFKNVESVAIAPQFFEDSRRSAKERTPVKEGLVDIRYGCAGCGMETKRPIADEGH